MAQGYAQVTGKPGVAVVTSGPAATNIVTPFVRRVYGFYSHGCDYRASGVGFDRF